MAKETKNIYQKLQDVRISLAAQTLKKTGNNKFAGYTYFELSDFLPTANKLMADAGLCGVIRFTPEMATLTIYDCDSDKSIDFTSPMSTASLKGCHEIQNLGACQSYLRRYLYSAVLELCDADPIDLTTKDSPKADAPEFDPAILKSIESAKDLADLKKAWASIPAGLRSIYTETFTAAKKELSNG